jgi:2-phosphosulfolactate phosphatase
MRADVVLLPSHLKPGQLRGRVVVVFDVLRATTTMAAALAAGAREIRIYSDTGSVRDAKGGDDCLRCGEESCLKPAGFDLGNSPGGMNEAVSGKTLLMSTTNGTRAILAAREAKRVLIGALVNASAVAAEIRRIGSDVTLLCAGTNGQIAMEDAIGAGAVLSWLHEVAEMESDTALLGMTAFLGDCKNLGWALRMCKGGINIIRAGLEEDIDYAARLNLLDVVGMVQEGDPIKVVRCSANG